MGVAYGRALCYNLFVRTSQKGFPLQSLTQKEKNIITKNKIYVNY